VRSMQTLVVMMGDEVVADHHASPRDQIISIPGHYLPVAYEEARRSAQTVLVQRLARRRADPGSRKAEAHADGDRQSQGVRARLLDHGLARSRPPWRKRWSRHR